MRKLFLALVAAVASAPAAQALDVTISTGSTLTVVGGYSQTLPLAAHFDIVNTGNQALTLGLERQVLSEVPGSENNFCFGVGCYPPSVSISPQPITLAAGATDNTFIGDYTANGNAGITRIRYAIYDVNGAGVPADTAYVTVTFDASQRVTGLAADLAASTLLSAPMPNPAVVGADVLLSVSAASAASSVRLVDLRDGRTVRTIAFSALSGRGTVASTCTTEGVCCAPGASCSMTGASCCASSGVADGGCFPTTTPIAAPAAQPTTVRITTSGLAPGVYGCMLIGNNGQPRAMRRLVIQ